MGCVRYDTATINKFEFDSNGFLHIKDVPIARTGVFPYLDKDGNIKMEAKLPEDLLNDQTIDSANSKPITDDHPNEPVTAKNNAQYGRGITANNAHKDGDKIKVDMLITNDSLISKVKDAKNGKQELSIGFSTDLVPVSGEYNGMHYDAMQKNIKINHIAVVKRGRAGHSVRLTADSAEMVQDYEPTKKGLNNMDFTTRRLADGTDIKVAKEDADKVAKLDEDNTSKTKKIAELDAQIKNLTAERDKLKGANSDADKETQEAKAKADALEKELDGYKSKMTNDALDKAIETRMGLIEEVKQFAGDSFDFKGKSEREMKLEAIKSYDSTDLSDSDDTYINAYFDAIKKIKKPKAVGYFGETQKVDSAESSTKTDRYHLAD